MLFKRQVSQKMPNLRMFSAKKFGPFVKVPEVGDGHPNAPEWHQQIICMLSKKKTLKIVYFLPLRGVF